MLDILAMSGPERRKAAWWYDETQAKFWQFVSRGEPCWRWAGSFYAGKPSLYTPLTGVLRAQRYSLFLKEGRIPTNELIAETTCADESCVNPDHLQWSNLKTKLPPVKLKEREQLRSHSSNLKKYGLTSEEYQEALLSQGGRCAICRGEPTNRRLAVDHDHLSGRFRGLLCTRCNQGLGMFKDVPEIVDRAAVYLRK